MRNCGEVVGKRRDLEENCEGLQKNREELAENRGDLAENRGDLTDKRAELEENRKDLTDKRAELDENRAELEANRGELEKREAVARRGPFELEEKRGGRDAKRPLLAVPGEARPESRRVVGTNGESLALKLDVDAPMRDDDEEKCMERREFGLVLEGDRPLVDWNPAD